MTERPTCPQCGRPTSIGSHKSEICGKCYITIDRSRPSRPIVAAIPPPTLGELAPVFGLLWTIAVFALGLACGFALWFDK